MVLCDWPFARNIMFSRFIRVVACVIPRNGHTYSPCMGIHYILFIHSSADGHLGCFHFLALMNNAAVNSCVHVSV